MAEVLKEEDGKNYFKLREGRTNQGRDNYLKKKKKSQGDAAGHLWVVGILF